MRYLILSSLLLLISSNCLAQSLSRNDFDKRLLTTLNHNYNVVELPKAFYDCTYKMYLIKPEDYFEGDDVALKCLKRYYMQVVFSDGGKKMWQIVIPHYKKSCIVKNSRYKNVLDVKGYCNCLVKQFNKHEIRLKTLISPRFSKSKLYYKIATGCVSSNKNITNDVKSNKRSTSHVQKDEIQKDDELLKTLYSIAGIDTSLDQKNSRQITTDMLEQMGLRIDGKTLKENIFWKNLTDGWKAAIVN